MKIKVLVIAPYPGLVELIKNLENELTDFELIIEQGDLAKSIELLEKYKHEDLDFIISRGGTAKLIGDHTAIPVLSIQVSGFDILRILTLLKGYQSTTIGMIGFNNVIQSFKSISKLMDIDINYIEIQNENEVAKTLELAKEKGVRVVVGDTVTVRLANEIGLQGVLITSGKESVIETFIEAKQLYLELKRLNTKGNIYELLLDQMEDAIVILDQSGNIQFANPAFSNLLGVSQNDSRSLFDHFHILQGLLTNDLDESQVVFQLAINEFEVFEVKKGHINDDIYYDQFYIRLRKSTFNHFADGVQLIYTYRFPGSTPHYFTSNTLFENSLEIAYDQLESKLPVCLLGEIGTGKRLFAQILSHRKDAICIEIKINKMSTKLFNQLLKLLEEANADMVLHIRGIDKATPAQQQRLYERLPIVKPKIIFSFTGDLDLLHNNDLKINKNLLPLLTKRPIYFPPLRERKVDLEELIQTFIVQFNEQFGKQVVGLKPEIMDYFLSYPWYGNLIDLRNIIKDVVKQSNEEFINESALSILNEFQFSNTNSVSNKGAYINLDQTLEEIERNIIQLILEQEEGNQSKVAKRLGINRSTLWRKMKNLYESK